MNLKTLFNKGIFKNNIKRFKWGSFLYLVFLFFSVPFAILVENFDKLVSRYTPTDGATLMLLRSEYLTMPILFGITIPTVAATLIFSNVHSPKQSVFVHGLPVKRISNYVSSLVAGFVLMAAPVLINAAVLLVMSVSRYGQIMSASSIAYWTAINISVLFIMFSVATFSAFLTGNAAVHIGLNVFFHVVPLLLALVIFLVSDIFLFGFTQSSGFFANEMVEKTPIVWLFGKALSHYRATDNVFGEVWMWIYLIGSVITYGLGYILYKNRKIEASGDVAAFKAFRPILKYAVTAAVAVCTFGITSSMDISASAKFILAASLSGIAYFACEMLMCKSFKVLKSYKGFIGFIAFAAAFICFFAYTSVFGYETRVPDADKIVSAGITENYRVLDNAIADKAFIEEVRKIHKVLTDDIPTTNKDEKNEAAAVEQYSLFVGKPGRRYSLRVRYKLANGKTLERLYQVNETTRDYVMSIMYQNTDFKLKATELARLNVENVDSLALNVVASNYAYGVTITEDASALMENVKKDIESLGYEELKSGKTMFGFRIGIDVSYLENMTKKIFKEKEEEREFVNPEDMAHAYQTFDIEINPNFKNTYAYLKEKGYYAEAINAASQNLWILKKPVSRDGEIYSYKDDKGEFGEFLVSPKDLAKLSIDDAVKVTEFMAENNRKDVLEGNNYFVFDRSRTYDDNLHLGSNSVVFNESELPDYIKKYLDK